VGCGVRRRRCRKCQEIPNSLEIAGPIVRLHPQARAERLRDGPASARRRAFSVPA
jgi:hypothetical protein